jgi:NitT/TauT family transport system substrate-binding protein
MTTRTLPYWGVAIAAMTAIATSGTLAGCATAGGTAPAVTAQLEQRTITVDSVPAAEEGGLYVAAAQGFFARQGLNVKINSITGGEAGIPDLQQGSAQLVAGNYVSFVLAQIAGKFGATKQAVKPINMRIIAAGAEMTPGTNALYVMPHSKFQTVAELAKAHARVGLNTPNNIGAVMMGALLDGDGYQLSDIRQVIPKGGFGTLLAMLPAGKVDAAWLPQPLAEIAEQQYGAAPIADFDQGSLQDLPFTGYIGTTDWVTTHPHTVAAFLRALEEGQRLADTDRSAVEAAMEMYTDIKPIIADTMAIDTYPLEMDVPQLQRVADSMYEFGLMGHAPAPYRISTMIQPEPGLITK